MQLVFLKHTKILDFILKPKRLKTPTPENVAIGSITFSDILLPRKMFCYFIQKDKQKKIQRGVEVCVHTKSC